MIIERSFWNSAWTREAGTWPKVNPFLDAMIQYQATIK